MGPYMGEINGNPNCHVHVERLCLRVLVYLPVRYTVEAASLFSSAALLPDVYGAPAEVCDSPYPWDASVPLPTPSHLRERRRRSTYPRTPALNVEIPRQRRVSATTGNIERGGAGVDTTFPRARDHLDSRLFLPCMDPFWRPRSSSQQVETILSKADHFLHVRYHRYLGVRLHA